MDSDEQDMIARAEPEQRYANERKTSEIKRHHGCVGCESARRSLACPGGQVAEVGDSDFNPALGMNLLHGSAVAFVKCRPPGFMTADDLIEAFLKCADIEITADAVCDRNVACGIAGDHLIHDPHLMLRRGERCGLSGWMFRNPVRCGHRFA